MLRVRSARRLTELITQTRGETRPDHAYELLIKTDSDSPFLNAMRGRIFLPCNVPPSRNKKGAADAEIVVVISTDPELVDAAKASGADHVGGSDLVPSVRADSIESALSR